MATDESLEELVVRRNKRLVSFFTSNGFDVRIIGEEHRPAVVLDESMILSCFVKNFDLFFKKSPFSNHIVRQFKLRQEPEVTPFEIREAIELCTHRPVYKIRITNSDLYLAGYNYLNSEDGIGRYPVFARYRPKLFLEFDYAERIINDLKDDEYDLEII